jgi:hypothetical protein
MRKLNEEDRLVRRITHLRTLLCHTEEVQIVITLKEFIAETEGELVTLNPARRSTATLH